MIIHTIKVEESTKVGFNIINGRAELKVLIDGDKILIDRKASEKPVLAAKQGFFSRKKVESGKLADNLNKEEEKHFLEEFGL